MNLLSAVCSVADFYDWFIEGFDAADLKDAKTLKNELNN